MDHKIIWTHETDHVEGRAVCEASEGSDCRVYCDQGCESYTLARDDRGPYHTAETLNDELVRHDLVPYGGCVVVDWLNEDPGMLAELRDGSTSEVVIGETPISERWQGDYYTWEVAQ